MPLFLTLQPPPPTTTRTTTRPSQPWLKYAPPRHVPRTGPSSPAYVPDAVRRLSRHVPTPTVVTSGPSKVDYVSLMGPRLRTVHTRTVPSGP